MANPNERYDDNGEILPREADERDPDEPGVDLDAIAEATTRRIRGQAMSPEQMREIMQRQQPIPVGIMGWAAKVGAAKAAKGDKVIPGMRLTGQVVSTFTARGKFGTQQVIVVAGIYSCPAHLNGQNQKIDAVNDERGRRVFACDASTIDLPNYVGDVIDVELQSTGGSGKRHAYKRVDVYPADGSGTPRPAKATEEAPAQN